MHYITGFLYQGVKAPVLWETPWDYPDVGVSGVLRTPLTPTSGGSPRRFLENQSAVKVINNVWSFLVHS